MKSMLTHAEGSTDSRFNPQTQHVLAPSGVSREWLSIAAGHILEWLIAGAALAAFFFIVDGRNIVKQIVADARSERSFPQFSSAQCDPPDAPLETLIGTIASRADGKPVIGECVYVTAPLGQNPQLRFTKPKIAAAE